MISYHIYDIIESQGTEVAEYTAAAEHISITPLSQLARDHPSPHVKLKRETALHTRIHTYIHTFHLGLGELLKFVKPMEEGAVEWNGWHRRW